MEAIAELSEHITTSLSDEVIATKIQHDELTVTIHPQHLKKVLTFLRDDSECQFKQLIDVCGADYPERPERFEVVYHLLSMGHNHRIRLKASVDEKTPIDSVVSIFKSAGWFEREAWDMYGIMFAGNPDLRRILTDYGFKGYPLRKDFPVTGYVEVRYSEEDQRIVYEPVSLRQDMREFDFMSPWEGADYILADKKTDEDSSKAEEKK